MTPTTNSRKTRLSISVPSRRADAFSPVASTSEKRCFHSRELFSGNREISILHNEQTYRLTITKLGKLILTK